MSCNGGPVRILATMIFIVVSLVSGARAGEIPGSISIVAGWRLSAFENGGKFSHCDIATSYRNGILMAFAMSSDASWRIGWGHPNARFTVGESVPLSLYVDGVGPYRVVAIAKASNMAMAELSPTNDFFNSVRKGKELVVVTSEGSKQAFDLSGTSAALKEVAECTLRYSAVRSAATPSPTAQAPTTPPSVAQSAGTPNNATTSPALAQTSTYKMNNVGQTGELVLTHGADGSLSVDVAFRRRGCLGSISVRGKQQGSMIIARTKSPMPNSPPCTLRMDAKEDALIVQEENCGLFHGMSCEANGTYKLAR